MVYLQVKDAVRSISHLSIQSIQGIGECEGYESNGSNPFAHKPSLSPVKETEEKILHLRCTYHPGPLRIAWYLKCYYDITISGGGVRNVLLRHGLNRLPRNAKKRTVLTQSYEKQVPGHPSRINPLAYFTSVMVLPTHRYFPSFFMLGQHMASFFPYTFSSM